MAKERAAAICFKIRDGVPLFLLERTRNDRCWTMPKGKLEPNETAKPWKGAKREAREEAGVTGKVYRDPVGRFTRVKDTAKKTKEIPITFFLFHVGKEKAKEAEREYKWFTLEGAFDALGERRGVEDQEFVKQTCEILKKARERIDDLLQNGELSNSRAWWKTFLRLLIRPLR